MSSLIVLLITGNVLAFCCHNEYLRWKKGFILLIFERFPYMADLSSCFWTCKLGNVSWQDHKILRMGSSWYLGSKKREKKRLVMTSISVPLKSLPNHSTSQRLAFQFMDLQETFTQWWQEIYIPSPLESMEKSLSYLLYGICFRNSSTNECPSTNLGYQIQLISDILYFHARTVKRQT